MPAAPLLLHAAATLRPPRAASVGRFVRFALDGIAPTLAALAARRAAWLEAPVRDGRSALERLVAEDLGPLLAAAPALSADLAAWDDPERVLAAARDGIVASLGELGIDLDPPAIHVGDGLPPPYDPPSLLAVSIDRADAAAFGLAPGIHLDRRRLSPFASELVLGHVLVHAALGQRSPECLGRGLEEGLAEVLGALWAGARLVGAAAAEASFAARLLTPGPSPHRQAFLDQVGRSALLHRRHGLDGLGRLVRDGRDAVKRAELALGLGDPGAVGLGAGTPDAELGARLDRLLLGRGRPLAVSPLAYHLGRSLAAGRRVALVAGALGLEPALAERAARELMERAFVLVLAADGEVLVDDLELVLASGQLRYQVPPAPAATAGGGSGA